MIEQDQPTLADLTYLTFGSRLPRERTYIEVIESGSRWQIASFFLSKSIARVSAPMQKVGRDYNIYIAQGDAGTSTIIALIPAALALPLR